MRNTGIKVMLALLTLMFTGLSLGTAYASDAIGSDRHFELVDNTWYAVDRYNEKIHGWTYDASGNLYEAKENGSLYINERVDGKYFNQDGVYMPIGVWNKEQFDSMCESFEKNKYVTVANEDEILKFTDYYLHQYRLWSDSNISFPFSKTASGNRIKLPDELAYNREETVNAVLNKFGTPVGNNASEMMYDACKRVTDTLEYDAAYQNRSIDECLRDNKAVCWLYAKAVTLMLQNVGVEAENLLVNNFGTNHMIVRARDGERWVYCDPTACDNIELERFGNLSYEDVVFHYKPFNGVHID